MNSCAYFLPDNLKFIKVEKRICNIKGNVYLRSYKEKKAYDEEGIKTEYIICFLY